MRARGPHPGRGEALAVLLLARPLRAPAARRAGADGLVLFNRFYQPDIDVEHLQVEPSLHLSTLGRAAAAAALAGSLSGRVRADARGHRRRRTRPWTWSRRVMAGADAVQMVSALLPQGPEHLHALTRGPGGSGWRARVAVRWPSLKGVMNLDRCPDPGAVRARELHADAAERPPTWPRRWGRIDDDRHGRPGFAADALLRDGTSLHLRAIRPDDKERLARPLPPPGTRVGPAPLLRREEGPDAGGAAATSPSWTSTDTWASSPPSRPTAGEDVHGGRPLLPARAGRRRRRPRGVRAGRGGRLAGPRRRDGAARAPVAPRRAGRHRALRGGRARGQRAHARTCSRTSASRCRSETRHGVVRALVPRRA